jgi:hypothetical protein
MNEAILNQYLPLIIYIIISVIWILVFTIAGTVFGLTTLSIILSLIWVIIYIPLIIWYISKGEPLKAWYVVRITFITTLIYLIYETVWLLAEFTRRTVRNI